jgi:hypothetical protein
MEASGKWIKTVVGLKPAAAEKEKRGGGGGAKCCKWSRLWWSSSGGQRGAASAAEVSETSSSAADALSSVVAAVRIQTAFRGFLARRAVRALRGIVRLQAMVRGGRVRQQLAVTAKCMQALLRVQARARDRRTRLSCRRTAETSTTRSTTTRIPSRKQSPAAAGGLLSPCGCFD